MLTMSCAVFRASHCRTDAPRVAHWQAGQEALKRKPFQMFHRYAQFQSFQSLADQKTETYLGVPSPLSAVGFEGQETFL
jgi:hypothetical protein